MEPLTINVINKLPMQAGVFEKISGGMVEENGSASPILFVLLFPLILGLVMAVGGLFGEPVSVWGGGLLLLAVCVGLVFLLDRFSRNYFRARGDSVMLWLDQQDRADIIDQAASAGPDYIGRQFLFHYLDERDPGWEEGCLDHLVAFVRDDDNHSWQRSYVKSRLDEVCPDWRKGRLTFKEREVSSLEM